MAAGERSCSSADGGQRIPYHVRSWRINDLRRLSAVCVPSRPLSEWLTNQADGFHDPLAKHDPLRYCIRTQNVLTLSLQSAKGKSWPGSNSPGRKTGQLTLARWWRAAFSRSNAAISSIWSLRSGPRVQPMRGFDPIYTDIVDYIVRCTHRIWDERDVGLIYTHYTHNPYVYLTTRTMYNREDVVHDTIQRLVSLPERRGMATQVIWSGNDKDGFYTSHLVTGSGRHTQAGPLRAADRADLRFAHHRRLHDLREQDLPRVDRRGPDGDPEAARDRPAPLRRAAGARLFEKGQLALDIGENRRLIGQNPPEAEPDLEIAATTSSARRCAGCTRSSTSGCSGRSRTSTPRR